MIRSNTYLFSPSLIDAVCDRIEEKARRFHLSESEVDKTQSHAHHYNQIFIKMLKHLDEEKWQQFHYQYANDLRDLLDADIALSDHIWNFEDYDRACDVMQPMINRLIEPFLNCVSTEHFPMKISLDPEHATSWWQNFGKYLEEKISSLECNMSIPEEYRNQKLAALWYDYNINSRVIILNEH